jgi:hypothetical protein
MQKNRLFLIPILVVFATGCTTVSIATNKDPAFSGKISHIVVQYTAYVRADSLGYDVGKTMQEMLTKKGVETVISFRSAVDLEPEVAWRARTESITEQFRLEIRWSKIPDRNFVEDGSFSRYGSEGALDILLFEKDRSKPVWRAAVDVNTNVIDAISASVGIKLAKVLVRNLKADGLLN